ncbi:MAG: hypothetical protein MIO92_01700 [Methanosarcinaceae archaeon]|nr:hypothetical protein [Methanosarcinaceae archaeon]
MKKWKISILVFVCLLTLSGLVSAGETLYNGIELPDQWPPAYEMTRDPMPVPYLDNVPDVIPIDVGRQLFIDGFLIDKTTMKRSFYTPEYHKLNPVIKL